MTTQKATRRPARVNLIGLSKTDYRGAPTTLCQGCGHNSIASQIMSACYELNIVPEDLVKFSGIGCSSKSPTYFLGRSFGFNSLHGRMPAVATGAMFADTSLKGIGVSGDGDTASIGMGQFKHAMRRNAPFIYIVENNGVYGLTKGQFSATSEKGLVLKKQGINPYMPVDICMEALASNASFVARTFAGDPKQVKNLIKAALSHNGLALIDIISPCVSFNNRDEAEHSYAWGKAHETPLHKLDYIPNNSEIVLDQSLEPGEVREVEMQDGSKVLLKRVEKDYDPHDRFAAMRAIEAANQEQHLLTGLLYINTEKPSLIDLYDLPDEPLNRLSPDRLRPAKETIQQINDLMF